MKKIYFIIPLLAIAVIIFLLVFLNKNNNLKDNFNSGTGEDNSQNQETQGVENSNADSFTDSTNNEINTEGSGSGSGGGGASQITGCVTAQLSYSLENPQIIQVCNAYFGGICTDKTATCSIEVHNLDNEIEGNFNLEVFFVEEGKDRSDPIETRNSKFIIAPRGFHLYEETLNIIGINENDTSNKEITCFYDTLETPKRETC